MGKPPLNSETIWTRIEVRGLDDCWPWKGKVDRFGYGHFQITRRDLKPHRFVCALVYGERDSTWYALHSCDNRACCNPAHLRWGKPKENTQDMMIRGRHVRRGSLSVDDHNLISLLIMRDCRPALIAEAVGISYEHARRLKNDFLNPPPHPPLAGA